MTSPALRRVIRRETHSPRTVAMIIAVVILVLGLAYVGVELILYLASQPALLIGPAAAWSWLLGVPSEPPGSLMVAGSIVLAAIGVLLVWLAIAPGRLSKHTFADEDRAVIVDNGVIASSLAQRLSEDTGLAREAILVGVAHRRIDITLRPDAEVALDTADVRAIADGEISSYRLSRAVRTSVRVDRREEKGIDS